MQGGIKMGSIFCVIAITAALAVIGGIADLVAIAVGYLDPWDFR
jgi:hypothetical protein